jgi:hypothetical protein
MMAWKRPPHHPLRQRSVVLDLTRPPPRPGARSRSPIEGQSFCHLSPVLLQIERSSSPVKYSTCTMPPALRLTGDGIIRRRRVLDAASSSNKLATGRRPMHAHHSRPGRGLARHRRSPHVRVRARVLARSRSIASGGASSTSQCNKLRGGDRGDNNVSDEVRGNDARADTNSPATRQPRPGRPASQPHTRSNFLAARGNDATSPPIPMALPLPRTHAPATARTHFAFPASLDRFPSSSPAGGRGQFGRPVRHRWWRRRAQRARFQTARSIVRTSQVHCTFAAAQGSLSTDLCGLSVDDVDRSPRAFVPCFAWPPSRSIDRRSRRERSGVCDRDWAWAGESAQIGGMWSSIEKYLNSR